MTSRFAAVGALALAMAAPTALAHHAFSAEFDANLPIRVQGKIVQVDWINPHAWVHVEHVHEDGTTEQLPLTGGVALGVMSGLDYNVKSIDLAPGDTVFLYTDGIPEAINGDDEEFGMERLCTTLTAAKDRNAHDLTDCVLTDLQAFVGDTPQFDDITCLTLRFTGAAP